MSTSGKKPWTGWRRSGKPVAELIRGCVEIQSNGCWFWLGRKTPAGYGSASLRGRNVRVHRLSYETFVGAISQGMVIDHLCRNRACANPDHLDVVTQKENLIRSIPYRPKSLKKPYACKRGHVFSETGFYIGRNGNGHRHRRCRVCLLARAKSRRGPAIDIAHLVKRRVKRAASN